MVSPGAQCARAPKSSVRPHPPRADTASTTKNTDASEARASNRRRIISIEKAIREVVSDGAAVIFFERKSGHPKSRGHCIARAYEIVSRLVYKHVVTDAAPL